MHSLKLLCAVAAIACVAVPAAAQSARTALKDKAGKDVGTVELVQSQAGVLLKVSVNGLPPGEHAFHIHAVGKCEPPFESAGPHFNPGNQKHGMMAGHGHAGDMPNLHVPQGGQLTIEILNTAVTLAKGGPNSLLDNDGSAVVIHASADDYRSDPAGNAGDRIACGVIGEPATRNTGR